MAGMRRFSRVAAMLACFFCLTTCENALLGTLRAIVEESSDPLLVTIEPAAGTYTLPQSVQLSANKAGAVIRYTTDGSDPTAQTGTVYTGAISVPASAAIRARAFLAPYSDSAVAVGEYTIPFGGQIKRFALDAQAEDHFGQSVAIDGDYAIVGAPDEDGASIDKYRGAAYIFYRTGPDTWDDGVKIIATNPTDEHAFGNSVDIDGDYAIVGNRYWAGTGSAYIFHRTGPGNVWDTGVKIDPPAPVADGYFGYAVSISGDYAVVGAFGEDGGIGGANNFAGAVYFFHRTGVINPNEWAQRTRVVETTYGLANDNFGRSVSIDGDYAIIGSPYADPTQSNAGRAFIFERTGENAWTVEDFLTATIAQENANFGWSVDISGNYAIVGSVNETEGAFGAGAAYIFYHSAADLWEVSGRITATDPQGLDNFGDGVAISGENAIVTAPNESTVADRAGAIYCFHRTATNTWNAGPTAKWTAFDGGALEFFGRSVAMDGMYAIVGAHQCDGPAPGNILEAGGAYILH